MMNYRPPHGIPGMGAQRIPDMSGRFGMGGLCDQNIKIRIYQSELHVRAVEMAI